VLGAHLYIFNGAHRTAWYLSRKNFIWHGKKLVLAREEGGGGSTVKIALFI